MAQNSNIPNRLMSDLQSTFGLTREQAAGFVGNLAHESGGFSKLQEVKPAIKGSKGGYGYAQWTGPRRKSFEAFAKKNELEPTSYDANWGFLKHELENDPYERKQFEKIRTATTAKEAATIAAKEYFRPAKKSAHIDRRVKLASEVADKAPDASPIPEAPSEAVQVARAEELQPPRRTAFTNSSGQDYVRNYDFTPNAYTRNLPINDDLQSQLALAVSQSDPSVSIRVTSGGQTSSRDPKLKNAKGGWTGSTRHDDGGAADFVLTRDGKELTVADNSELYQNVAKNLAAQGVSGIGVKTGGTGFIHAGGGDEAAWGYSGGSNGAKFLDPKFASAIQQGRDIYSSGGGLATDAIEQLAPRGIASPTRTAYASEASSIPQLNLAPNPRIAELSQEAGSAPHINTVRSPTSNATLGKFDVEGFMMPGMNTPAFVKRTPEGEDYPIKQVASIPQRSIPQQAQAPHETDKFASLFEPPTSNVDDFSRMFESPQREPGRGYHPNDQMNTMAATFAIPQGVRPASVGDAPKFEVIRPGLQMDGVGDGANASELFDFGKPRQSQQIPASANNDRQAPPQVGQPIKQAGILNQPLAAPEPFAKFEPPKQTQIPSFASTGTPPLGGVPQKLDFFGMGEAPGQTALMPPQQTQMDKAITTPDEAIELLKDEPPKPQERIDRDGPLDFLPETGPLGVVRNLSHGIANGYGANGLWNEVAKQRAQPQGIWNLFGGGNDSSGSQSPQTTQQRLRAADQAARNAFTYSEQEKKDREGQIDVLAEYR